MRKTLPLGLDTRLRGYDGRGLNLQPGQPLHQEIEEALVLALEQDPAIALLAPVEDRLAVARGRI